MTKNYKDKYLKYKNKYLQLKKIQKGGIPFCERAYENKLGTCWAIVIKTIITFGIATSTNLRTIIKDLNFDTKNEFIERRIEEVRRNHLLNDFFPDYILNDSKSIYLKNILDKFIDRYCSKILDKKNPLAPVVVSPQLNPGRCELVIAENFKKLFDNPILKYNDYSGGLYDTYLFANLLSIFFLNEKVSLINYYDKFDLINFDPNNDIGIIINTKDHACCFYICEDKPRYYNDMNGEVYECNWLHLLKSSSNLYIKLYGNFEIIDYDSYPKKEELSRVESLTLVKKHQGNSELDTDIINQLNSNFSNIKDKTLQYNLGCFFDVGIEGVGSYAGIVQNKTEAMRWYQLAVAQGDANSQFKVGQMYSNGEGGVAKNEEEAMRWYMLAVAKGHAEAHTKMAIIFEHGIEDIIEKNMEEAIRWYHLAAEHGHVYSQFILGFFYQHGVEDFIKQNMTEAARWFHIAAIHGNVYSQYILGVILYNGIGNVEEDKEKGKLWLHCAATNDNTNAQFLLGLISLEDDDTPENKAEAYKWFALTAEKGFAKAQVQLGNMFENNIGVPQNIEEAVKLYRLAATQEDAEGQYKLGFMFENGKGVKQDISEAERLYSLAAEQGNVDAQNALTVIKKNP